MPKASTVSYIELNLGYRICKDGSVSMNESVCPSRSNLSPPPFFHQETSLQQHLPASLASAWVAQTEEHQKNIEEKDQVCLFTHLDFSLWDWFRLSVSL